ncbi:MAG: 2-hydroxyacid dehydrogenase [Proteobacteria bacterium]|nr:2-hydroxyacid dehydrogenase [Pseudomonadota bacterium]
MNATPSVLLASTLPPMLKGPLAARFRCVDYAGAADQDGLLAREGATVRALVQGGGGVSPPALLDRLPALELISVFGVGYDGVPIDYCRARGIRVTNTPDVLTDDVADIAVALVLMSARGLVAANAALMAGDWARGTGTLTTRLAGKRAGILGLGRIGKAIAERLAAMRMDIAYTGRSAQPVPYRYVPDLAVLAAEADFLIVACPGGPATRNLVDARVLGALGAKGTLVNIARGSIVDEPALIEALAAGRLRGAALDVYAHEPDVPAALRALPNVVLLPHVGSATQETRAAMADLCRANVERWFDTGTLLTLVPELR